MEVNAIGNKFEKIFKSSPLVVQSPGRINLIGEHTDYNEGFVLPAAIDKQMIIAIAKNGTNTCHLYSYDYEEHFEFSLLDFHPVKGSWANYIMGVVDQFISAGYQIHGFDCVFGGNIPIGAGLSSSAALECGVAYALNSLYNLGVEKSKLIYFAQMAEHKFAGVACGIMDQFASLMGKEHHAIRLDCRSLDYSYFPIHLKDFQIILCDTHVKHSLANSEYNTRRIECESGVAAVKENHNEVKSLRDIDKSMLEEVKGNISGKVYDRCLFIIEENQRLLSGCKLLEAGNIAAFGEKMYGSHQGLSVLYEVSCPELDFLVEITKNLDYVVGARMMGGGFGGCTINLVEKNKKEDFKEYLGKAYLEKFNIKASFYEANIVDGTSISKAE
ncbi:MAG: galactokinase [Bacteroidota bacterium]|nr:galactokinase [Bacteroidota bacterium]